MAVWLTTRVATMWTAQLCDLPGAYAVCLQTGDAGRDASGLFDDPYLLGHTYVGPYLAHDPSLCLVIGDEHGIGGYLLATADTTGFEAWREREWLPALRVRYPRGSGSERDRELIELLHDPEYSPPEVLADHPAHLHIDLMPRLQRQGWGRRMMLELESRLRERRIRGVHLGVSPRNESARAFYASLGYVELHRGDDVIYLGLRVGER